LVNIQLWLAAKRKAWLRPDRMGIATFAAQAPEATALSEMFLLEPRQQGQGGQKEA